MLDLALTGELTVAYDDRGLSEWREKFGCSPADVESLLAFFEEEGLRVAPSPLGVELPDPDDLPFLKVAREAGAALVTGNLKRYPPESRRGVKAMGPAAFLEWWTRETGNRDTEEGCGDG